MSNTLDGVNLIIKFMQETAGEGKMAFFPDQLTTKLHYYPDHHVAHIRLSYVCGLSPQSCAMMSARLVEKIVAADLDKLPIIAEFSTNRGAPAKTGLELTRDTVITPAEIANITGMEQSHVVRVTNHALNAEVAPDQTLDAKLLLNALYGKVRAGQMLANKFEAIRIITNEM